MLRTSAWNGQVWREYGPKNIPGEYTMVATAVNHDTVTTSQVLTFANSSPTNIELSASPQTVPQGCKSDYCFSFIGKSCR